MDYLIKIINELQDKLLQAKGYVEAKRFMESNKLEYKNYIIKFKDLIGREASTEKEEVDASMYKKPTLGSIKKLKEKNLYRGRFQYKGISYTTTAKRFEDCYNKHEAKIKEVMAEYENIISNKKVGFDKNTILGDWWNYWYKTYKENDPDIKPSTKYSYETYYRAYFKESDLFKMKIGKVSTFDVQSFLDPITAVSSRNKAKIYINSCFEKARDIGLIPFNPVRAVAKIGTKKEKTKRYLTDDEVEVILDHCRRRPEPVYSKLHNLYRFLWHTGLRVGEALALTWNDIMISFEKKYIVVNKSYSDNFKTIDTPKTLSSIRKVPLFDQVKTLLDEMDKTTEYIFGDLQNKQLRDYAKQISGKIGIKFTNHMFRHTFASNCIAKGINAKTVQKWLGHAKIDMTMNVYVDVIDDLEKSDIDKYND